jgi:hypothetical protein
MKLPTPLCVRVSRIRISLSVPEQIAGGLVVTNTKTIMVVASFHRVAGGHLSGTILIQVSVQVSTRAFPMEVEH